MPRTGTQMSAPTEPTHVKSGDRFTITMTPHIRLDNIPRIKTIANIEANTVLPPNPIPRIT